MFEIITWIKEGVKDQMEATEIKIYSANNNKQKALIHFKSKKAHKHNLLMRRITIYLEKHWALEWDFHWNLILFLLLEQLITHKQYVVLDHTRTVGGLQAWSHGTQLTLSKLCKVLIEQLFCCQLGEIIISKGVPAGLRVWGSEHRWSVSTTWMIHALLGRARGARGSGANWSAVKT